MADGYKVGGELDAWCTSCRLMKWHTIVALVAGKPAKVECQGCGKQHQYRAQPPGTAAAAGDKPARTRTPRATAAPAPPVADFEELLGGRAADARAYSPDQRYELNDVVRHPSFDIGVVTATPAPQKIEVTFRDGKKMLLHDRAGAAPSKLGPAPRRDDDAPNAGTSDSPRGLK